MRRKGRQSSSEQPPRAAEKDPLGDTEGRTLPRSAPPEALCRAQRTRSLKACGFVEGVGSQCHTSLGDEDVISGRSRKPGEAGASLQVRADACSVYTAALEVAEDGLTADP